MPSSYTSSLRFNLQFTGESINLWGEILNSGVFQLADYAVAGWLTKTVTGNFALTTANGAADEARAAMVKLSGSPASDFAMTIPSVSKRYEVWNATARVATITTGAGATVAIDPGDIVTVICDGSNVKTPGYGGLSIKGYIDATAWSYNAGNLPAQSGNAGKFVKTDGTTASWQTLQLSDVSDFAAYAANALALQVAFAVAL